MSKIIANLEGDKLIIRKSRARETDDDIEEIDLRSVEYGKKHKSKITVSNKEQIDSLIFITTVNEEDSSVAVFANKRTIYYVYGDFKDIYKMLVKVKYKVLSVRLNKNKFSIFAFAYILNKFKLDINRKTFNLGDYIVKDIKIEEKNKKISKYRLLLSRNFFNASVNKNILLNEKNILINNVIKIVLNINGIDVDYRLAYRRKKVKKHNLRYFYAPLKGIYLKDFAIHVRRTIRGYIVLVKRKKEAQENTFKFRLLENRFISFIMYYIGKLLSKFRKKKINLFYEKFASKSEEGVLELCEMCQEKGKNSNNYFIIDENSEDYDRIKNHKVVVKKYSLKYYWLFYNSSRFIASESPNHLTIVRSNNKFFRRAIYDKKFVFLQHGIIYMKNMAKNGIFYGKGKENEAEYFVVSSEKERDVVVDMLGYDENELIKTGLAMYDNIKYSHIDNNSEDKIMIMLTWKNYEEHLYNFEESTYYKNIIQIYDMIKKYIDKEKIVIVPHPKVHDLLAKTDMKDNIWLGKISEIVSKAKMLITDYSSICYNAFFQGAGVIFYQEDLEVYETENGVLIPRDDEYIGKRVFNMRDLENIIKETIVNRKIKLNIVRTKEHEKRYKDINEFSDGKNRERICKHLLKCKII